MPIASRFCGFLLLCGLAAASEPPRAGWRPSVHLGATLTEGNSETRLAHAALSAEGETRVGPGRASLEGTYGESRTDGSRDRTAESLLAQLHVQRPAGERIFLSLDASGRHDGIARISYRAVAGPGFGAYLYRGAESSLLLESGPSYVWERVAGARDDYLALRVAERFVSALGPAAGFWQSLEYLPKADDPGDYLVNGEIGVEAAVNARWTLRLVLQGRYDRTPGPDTRRHDLSLITGFRLAL